METQTVQGASTSPAPDKNGDGKQRNLTANAAVAQMLRKAQAEAAAAGAEKTVETAPEAQETPETQTPESTAEQAPPEETTSETTEATEGKADDVLSKTTFTPEQQEIFDKRIKREAAKTKKLKAELEAATAKLEQLEKSSPQKEQSQVTLGGPNPLAEVNDAATLQRVYSETKETIRFIEAQLDRDNFPEAGLQIEGAVYTKQQLRDALRQAKITLEDHIPQRNQFLAQRNQAQQKAFETFPFLKDRESDEYQMVQETRRANPWIDTLPAADWLLGVFATGLKALDAQTQAKNAKPPRKPAEKAGSDQAATSTTSMQDRASPTAKAASQLRAETERLNGKRGITAKDAVRQLQLRSQLRNSR